MQNLRFRELLKSGQIGEMSTKNRIIMGPMGISRCERKGRYGMDIQKAYYEARAAGGVGVIITEGTVVEYQDLHHSPKQARIDDDKFIPGLSDITEIIKKHGARAVVQLDYSGSATLAALSGLQPLVVSSSLDRPGLENAKEVSREDIENMIIRFTYAAERAQKAGFDAIEIHAAHHVLLGEFLSPVWNNREDEYGGSLENRARLLVELIRAIKRKTGANYPVWCKINSVEFGHENGVSIDEMQQIVIWAQEAGADAIHISGQLPFLPSNIPSDPIESLPPAEKQGYFIKYATAAKKVVEIPIIVGGRIDPILGEKTLRLGNADFISMGRALLADPDLPNKVMSDSVREIVPCLYCGCCFDPLDPTCAVNPWKGKEIDYIDSKAERKKKVLVIGGGPSGMEAAIIAAQRGHEVVLCEKKRMLGGQLILAGMIKKEYKAFANCLETQLKKYHVNVLLGHEVTTISFIVR